MVDWDGLWKSGATPWDLEEVSPPLRQFLKHPPSSAVLRSINSVLVPGCGRGYDLDFLADYFDTVTGIDISESAVRSARQMLSQSLSKGVSIETKDFFQLGETQYDAVFDYTFFCAIEPGKRDAWARMMSRVVRDGGILIAIVFPIIDAPPRDHPPYPVTINDYTLRLSPWFALEHLNLSPSSHASRIGKEAFAVFRKFKL